LTETAGQVKETINGLKNSLDTMVTKIPLKDPNEIEESANHLIEENLENLKNEMLSKAQSIGDDADKIADELMKDTEDVIQDAETGIVELKNNAVETFDSVKEQVMDVIKPSSPTHSIDIDSLKTSVPEPEIENILNGENETVPVSPEATDGELENLNTEEPEVVEEPTAPPVEEMCEDPPAPKMEDDLVVEDVKSSDE
jgi:hypothetical protein